MATTAIEQGLQSIALAAISPNPNNPRKHFDKAALQELAESIKGNGVRQPVLVRPVSPGKFQLVCGERRWRASKLAGKEEIPAIVDANLTDIQAVEIGILENLQREGVHPLEEALGYDVLLKMPNKEGEKATVEAIAAKVGKSIGYVYARCKLLALIAAGREAFLDDRISAGHAVLIARLQPRDQVKAIAACFNTYEGKVKNLDPQKLKFADIAEPDGSLLPEKALREWIQDNVNLKLKGVPWDLTDPNLVPAAGACSSCEKQSGSNPALFAELTIKGEATCFDAECFKSKQEAFVQIEIQRDKDAKAAAWVEETKSEKTEKVEPAEPLRQLSEQAGYTAPKPDQKVLKQGQWLAAKKGECSSVEQGLIVRGENAGEKRLVCCNGACKVHKHHLSGAASPERHDYDLDRYKQHKKSVQNKKRAVARAQLARQMVEHVGAKIPAEILREAVSGLLHTTRVAEGYLLWLIGLDPKTAKATDAKKIISKAKNVQLNQLVVAAVLLDALDFNSRDDEGRKELMQFSKVLGMKTASEILAAQDKRISEARACRGCGCTEETPCKYWDGNKHIHCKWVEDDLCSNPDCKKYAPAKKVQTAAKKKDK